MADKQPTPEPQATMRVWCERCRGSGEIWSNHALSCLCSACDGSGYTERPDPTATVQRMRALLERVIQAPQPLDMLTACGWGQLVKDIKAELAKAKEEPRG